MIIIDTFSILQEIAKVDHPVGATFMSQIFNSSQATIGRRLKDLEEQGFLVKVGNRGRVLSEKGWQVHNDKKEQYISLKNTVDFVTSLKDDSVQTLKDIGVIRKSLEILVVKLACENITDEELEELSEIMLLYSIEVRNGGSTSELDLKFHLNIAKYTRNDMLYQMITLLLTSNDAYASFHSLAKDFQTRLVGIAQHDEILSALKKRDSKRAQRKMAEHIDKVLKEIELYSQSNFSNMRKDC